MGYQTREGFKLPYYLGKQYGTEIKYLSGQQMWNGYFEQRKHWKKQQCLLLDLRTDEAFVFDPYNWQAEQASSVTELEISGDLSGILLFIPAKETERVSEMLRDFSLTLPFPAPIYIFEEKSDDLAKERDQRKEILKNLGLAERTILVQPSRQKDDPINQFGVWRSRVPKERRLNEPINLVDKGPYWRQRWVRNLINKAALEYRQLGYKPLNAYEMGRRLRASRFALDDLGRLKLGFGFKLESHCGCLWKVNIKGFWDRTWPCEPDCDGIPSMSDPR